MNTSSALQQIAAFIAEQTEKGPLVNETDVLQQIFMFIAEGRQKSIADILVKKHGRLVQGGPFKGMKFSDRKVWGELTEAAKLVGCYEQEMHEALEKAIARQPDVVVNVGCAEGYYAIGLALRLPGVPVYAFDIEPQAQEICTHAAELNGVSGQVHVAGRCDVDSLTNLVAGKRALIVMDCEGGEKELLTAQSVASLHGCDLIVECHDFMDRTITPSITMPFVGTHHLEYLQEGARDPSAFVPFGRLHSLDRWLAVCEYRPEVMFWLVCWSAARGTPG